MFYESGIDVSELEVDITLIPVGAFYTFGPKEVLVVHNTKGALPGAFCIVDLFAFFTP